MSKNNLPPTMAQNYRKAGVEIGALIMRAAEAEAAGNPLAPDAWRTARKVFDAANDATWHMAAEQARAKANKPILAPVNAKEEKPANG